MPLYIDNSVCLLDFYENIFSKMGLISSAMSHIALLLLSHFTYTAAYNIKACIHRPIFRGFAAESAVESDDSEIESIIDFIIAVLNMFYILNPLEESWTPI